MIYKLNSYIDRQYFSGLNTCMGIFEKEIRNRIVRWVEEVVYWKRVFLILAEKERSYKSNKSR